MLFRKALRSGFGLLGLVFAGVLPAQRVGQIILPARGATRESTQSTSALKWQTDARLHHGIHGVNKEDGVLSVDDEGIEFRPAGGPVYRWQFVQISTFKLTRRDLKLTGYENRAFHVPEKKSYHFDLSSPVPPGVASEIAQRVGRPSRNADPTVDAPAIDTIPVRHQAFFGGSNGILRVSNEGIDYLTSQSGDDRAAQSRDSRSWRWTDIQTVSSPDRYHLTVFAYRDTYSFELKQPVSAALIDQVTDEVYAHNNTDQRSSYVEKH